MFNVKTQNDFNALSAEDRYRYVAQNPYSDITKNEFERTKKKLYTEPTEAAKKWYSGLQYAGQTGDAENAILGNYNPVGYEWKPGGAVRGNLNALGVTDDRIGWDNGKVTLDGKEFMTPDVVMGGRSYASDEDFRKALQSFNQKNDVVAARQYINEKSPHVNVGWDGELGQVMVGSQALTPDYIENGVAYISRRRIDDALLKESAATGIYSNTDILNRSNDRWEDTIRDLYKKVESPKPFAYDAEKDPLYQEFKREWTDNNQAQYYDTIAKMNSQTGGAPSLGAMAAAWNMLQDSNAEIDAYKQQFRQQAYNEWQDEYRRDMDRLNTALGLQEYEFNRDYGVNRDNINDMYYRQTHDSDLQGAELEQEAAQLALDQNKELWPYTKINAISAAELSQLEVDTAKEDLAAKKEMTPLQIQLLLQQVEAGAWKPKTAEEEYLIAQAQRKLTEAELRKYGINFSSGQVGGASPDVGSVAPGNTSSTASGPPSPQGEGSGYSAAAQGVISQVGKLVTEPGRIKSEGLKMAVRFVINSDLPDAEKKRILETPSYFNATQDEIAGAYGRLFG